MSETSRELTIPYVLAHAEHRPWPMPVNPWVGTFTWHDLLFAHWPVPRDALRPLVPAALPLDTFDGHCWVGVIPFYMRDVRPRGCAVADGLPRDRSASDGAMQRSACAFLRDRPCGWKRAPEVAGRSRIGTRG